MKKNILKFTVFILFLTGCTQPTQSNQNTNNPTQNNLEYSDDKYNSFFCEDSNHSVYFFAGTSLYKTFNNHTEKVYNLYKEKGLLPSTTFCSLYKEYIYTIAIDKEESIKNNKYISYLIRINYSTKAVEKICPLEMSNFQNMFVFENSIYIYYEKAQSKELVVFNITERNVELSSITKNSLFENNYNYLISKYPQIKQLSGFNNNSPFHYRNEKIYTQDRQNIYEYSISNSTINIVNIPLKSLPSNILFYMEPIQDNWYLRNQEGVIKFDIIFQKKEILLDASDIERVTLKYPGVSFKL